MKRIRVGGLSLAAVAAVMAFSGASASALPEFSAPFGKPFTSTSKASLFETVGGSKLMCKADTNTGEVTGPQSGVITITFTGCKLTGIPCNTPGMAPGTIATNLLTMTIGYINKANKEVGVDLVEPFGGGFLNYGCGPTLFAKVQGSVIGRITPINVKVKPGKVFTLHFTQSKGVQKPVKLEGGPVDVLETSFGGPFVESGLMSTDKVKFGEVVELKA
jgi:hypothetical protein